MLQITRNINQSLKIGDITTIKIVGIQYPEIKIELTSTIGSILYFSPDIQIHFCSAQRRQVRLGIIAPTSIPITREESFKKQPIPKK